MSWSASLGTEPHIYTQVISVFDPIGDSTSPDTAHYTFIEWCSADEGEVADLSTDVHHSSGVHAFYSPLCYSKFICSDFHH